VSPRQVIQLPGAGHKAPIPAAVRIGNLLFSSAIGGRDPATGEYSDRPEDQARQAFRNMATVVRAAGGDVGDIAHVTVFLKDLADKKYVDEEWLAMFPDPEDRPARHAMTVDRGGRMLVQVEIIAVLDAAVLDAAVLDAAVLDGGPAR
jgi:2-iminobutanoate/2-iminopropanoate deaminase